MMMQNSAQPTPRQIVEWLYEAFNACDLKAMTEQLADDLDWNESENFMLSDRSPYRTPVAVAEGVFKRLAAQVRGCRVTPTAIFDAGETIVVLGRAKGMFNATGRNFDAQYVHVWHVRNEKVVGFKQIIDSLTIWRAQQGL
jgi:ketosteroid isomerase-like protein